MSLFDGKVEAPKFRIFGTWAEVEAFTLGLGNKFEGVQVLDNSYRVNYF